MTTAVVVVVIAAAVLRYGRKRTSRGRLGRLGDATDRRRFLQLLLLLLLLLFANFFNTTSFLDKVIDGLLRLFVLLQIVGVDSDFGKHFLEDGILAQILHVHHLKTLIFVPTNVAEMLKIGRQSDVFFSQL